MITLQRFSCQCINNLFLPSKILSLFFKIPYFLTKIHRNCQCKNFHFLLFIERTLSVLKNDDILFNLNIFDSCSYVALFIRNQFLNQTVQLKMPQISLKSHYQSKSFYAVTSTISASSLTFSTGSFNIDAICSTDILPFFIIS